MIDFYFRKELVNKKRERITRTTSPVNIELGTKLKINNVAPINVGGPPLADLLEI